MINSNYPMPDASLFHLSFQTMLSSEQSHLYLLHKTMHFTYMSLCYGEDMVRSRHLGISVSVQRTDVGD